MSRFFKELNGIPVPKEFLNDLEKLFELIFCFQPPPHRMVPSFPGMNAKAFSGTWCLLRCSDEHVIAMSTIIAINDNSPTSRYPHRHPSFPKLLISIDYYNF
jgi:hypothetical protein